MLFMALPLICMSLWCHTSLIGQFVQSMLDFSLLHVSDWRLLLFRLLRPQHLEWPASISLQSAVSTSMLSYLNWKTYLFGNTITNPSCCPFNPTPYLCILLCSWIANRCIFICMLCLFVLDCDGYITRSLSHWPWSPWSLVKCIDLACG